MLPLACPVSMTPDERVVGALQNTAKPYASSLVPKGRRTNISAGSGVNIRMTKIPNTKAFQHRKADFTSSVFSFKPESKNIKATFRLLIFNQGPDGTRELHHFPATGTPTPMSIPSARPIGRCHFSKNVFVDDGPLQARRAGAASFPAVIPRPRSAARPECAQDGTIWVSQSVHSVQSVQTVQSVQSVQSV